MAGVASPYGYSRTHEAVSAVRRGSEAGIPRDLVGGIFRNANCSRTLHSIQQGCTAVPQLPSSGSVDFFLPETKPVRPGPLNVVWERFFFQKDTNHS